MATSLAKSDGISRQKTAVEMAMMHDNAEQYIITFKVRKFVSRDESRMIYKVHAVFNKLSNFDDIPG